MFGLFGAAIFGILAAGAWTSAETQEQKSRSNSNANGYEFYFDKSGKMRHTGSGRKYTPEEIHKFYYPTSYEESILKYENRYWAVGEWSRPLLNEVFLTEQEAKDYCKKVKEKDESEIVNIFKVSDFIIDRNKKQYHKNF